MRTKSNMEINTFDLGFIQGCAYTLTLLVIVLIFHRFVKYINSKSKQEAMKEEYDKLFKEMAYYKNKCIELMCEIDRLKEGVKE